ncbi:hypothetical protein [Streptomyces sp. DSM 40484]|uniref:hypothetical protein n=1 Tax=Streptomyces kroppenstedtii TaxID=3051181 RepID=UPI0028D17A74|nr:hypothetical protein [Streptomyces sp. DSM 40484]
MSGHDERARHDEHGRHGDDEQEQHAGNGTVNHGPSQNSGPEGSGHTDTEGHLSDTPATAPGDPADPSDPADPGESADPVDPVESAESEESDGSSDTAPAEVKAEVKAEAAGGTPEKASADAPAEVAPLASAPKKSANGSEDVGGSNDSGGSVDSGMEPAGTESAGTEPAGTQSIGSESGGAAGGSDADGPGTDGIGLGAGEPAPDGFGSDELALRRLLHSAVEEIEPSDGTLDHLRRAVPARRARKRQAVVGMAAAALFIGTAVPALVHVSNSTGSNADPSVVGNSSATQGGASKESSSGSGSGGSGGSSKGSGKGDKKDKTDKGKGGGGTGGAQPTSSSAVASICTPGQLTAVAGGGTPDATGAVYGTFTVTNVSTASCSVVGGGSVTTTAMGAADQSQLMTAMHMAGDAAAGLPDPSTYASSLVLPPGGTYNVRFAWVPSSTCPTSGGNGGGEPTPDPTPTADPTGASGGTASEGTNGVDTQLMRADGTVDGSVSVSYTAEGGAAATAMTVSNACAGTVYRTGVLAGS